MAQTKPNKLITSSIISKLGWVIGFVALAFIIVFFGVLFTGNYIIDELNAIHTSNQLYDLSTKLDSNLDATSETLNKAIIHQTPAADLRLVFRENSRKAQENLNAAYLVQSHSTQMSAQLNAVKVNMDQYFSAGNQALEEKYSTDYSSNEVKKDVLKALQLKTGLVQSLRKFQTEVKRFETNSFQNLYQYRYLPLLSTILLTILSVSFISIRGIRIFNHLRNSLRNITNATQVVADGNLKFQAPILVNDEIGWLTSAFNQMIQKLEKGQNRLARLQSITAALSGAPDPEQVADVVMKEGLSVVGANAGLVTQVSNSGMEVEVIAEYGFLGGIRSELKKFSIETEAPINEAILLRKPIWIDSLEEHTERWPNIKPELLTRKMISNLSYGVIPLIVGGRALGAMYISFPVETVVTDEDREFCISLARQCAQALNRAQLYKEAQRAVQIRDEFLSIASHELRTPITPLKLQIQNLMRIIDQGNFTTLGEDRIYKMIKTADTQITRLTRLVEELLDVTRISSGKIELVKENADISKMVNDVVERYRVELANIHCDVNIHLEPGLLANIDVSRMEQVVANLLSNAMRYGAGKPIEFSTKRLSQNLVEIKVRDYGMGIAPQDQARIFERFERAAPTTNFGGLGLGLFIVKQIIRQHNGTIKVQSEIGKGSTFTVTLPTDLPFLAERSARNMVTNCLQD